MTLFRKADETPQERAIRRKLLWAFVVVLFAVSVAFAAIGVMMYRQYKIGDSIAYARGLGGLVAMEIDADDVDDYLERGHACEGYDATLERLYALREAYPGVTFLYVYQILEDGCHAVFDLDAPGLDASEPGEVLEFDQFDPSFAPYLDDLLAGREIEPIISNDAYGYLLTVYTPIYDSTGACVCYVGVDVSMDEVERFSLEAARDALTLFVIVSACVFAALYPFAERRVVQPIARIEKDAYHDALTGLKNKTAYLTLERELDADIQAGGAAFGIIMVDVNFLKRVNDTYGHERGDAYLQSAVGLICEVFGQERAFRVGGDEFVVVLRGAELSDAEGMVRRFKDEVRRYAGDPALEEWERVSAAVGAATYDKARDTSAQDVYKRADQEMYENKVAMKAQRTN